MAQTSSNFDALEKQLAKDALEKALKDLHGEILRDINRNKQSFSDEIKKSLTNLNEAIEKHFSSEIDRKLPILLERNFLNINDQVQSSFSERLLPVVDRAERNMERLESQGHQTLQSWGNMMKQFESLWTKPFFLMFLVSVFTGITVSLFSSYFLGRADRHALQRCEYNLQWYATKYTDMKKAEAGNLSPSGNPKVNTRPKTHNQQKKKSK